MVKRRGLFEAIFGKKQEGYDNRYNHYELINTLSSNFYAWDGNIFENDIVRAAIRPKANAVGKLNGKHIRGEGEEMKINPDPRIREILQYPNPHMSMQDFLMKMTYQRELNHNAFAYVKRDDLGYPEAVYPVPATGAEMVEKAGTLYARFSFGSGRSVAVEYDDVIHLRKDFNSNDIFGDRGTSAITPLMEVINTTDQGVVTAIKNGAIVRWILKFKHVLKKEDIEMQVKEFVNNYLSIAKEGGGAAATDPRYDVEQVKNDGQFVPNAAQMKESTQRLFSYFGVNDAIVQNKFTEDDWNSFYEAEIEPILIQLSNAFTKTFFSARERGHGNRIVFEASNLAYASMRTKLGLVAMVDRGAMTPNQWRRIMNLPPIVGGDEPVRRLDTAPVSDLEQEPEEGEDLKDDNEG